MMSIIIYFDDNLPLVYRKISLSRLHCLECVQKFIERQHRKHKIQNI